MSDRLRRVLGEDIRRLREDAALTRARLGMAAGVDPTYLARIEDGIARPTIETYARLAVGLGADLSAHLYPNTGPAIRDRHQARIVEALLAELHPRWVRYAEVAVRQPARGWIDVVLHDPEEELLVAVEIQSELRRLEQLLRWSAEKAASLPSWDGYGRLGKVSRTSSLLIVRWTRVTRDIGGQFARQLEAAYPAHPEDALGALRGLNSWTGASLIWADLGPERVRFMLRRAASRAIIRVA